MKEQARSYGARGGGARVSITLLDLVVAPSKHFLNELIT